MNAAARPWESAIVTRLAGANYVMGLDWRSPPDGDIRRAAADAVAGAPGSLAALRREHRQYGLGPAGARGAVAAAAVLASGRTGAWIGVWPLSEDRYWGVAARHGTLYPIFGDVVLADRDAARTWIARHADTATWDQVFAPTGWAEAAGETAALEDLFARRRPGPTLGDPRRLPAARIGAVAAAAASVAAAALIAHEHWTSGPAAGAPRPTPVRAAAPPPLSPAAHPLRLTLPICLSALDIAFSAGLPAGWARGAARCVVADSRASARITLQARDGTPVALAATPQPAGLAVDVARRTAHAEHDTPLPAATPLPPAPASAAKLALARLAETLGGRLGQTLVLASRDPAFDGAAHAPPRWSRLDWTLTTPAPPQLWQAGLADLPAAALTAIELDPDQRHWRVSGWIATEKTDD